MPKAIGAAPGEGVAPIGNLGFLYRGERDRMAGKGQPCRAFTLLASADFLCAAWLAWMTPLEAALSSSREAAWASSCAFAASPDSTASRVLRIAVFSEDLTAFLRWLAFSLVLIRCVWGCVV